jgi:hypothetical protein
LTPAQQRQILTEGSIQIGALVLPSILKAGGRLFAQSRAPVAPASSGTIRPISGGSPMGMGNIGSHAPVNPTTALSGAQRWLGPGYREIAPGVYRSADGLRQFRMTTRDLLPTHGNIGLTSILKRWMPQVMSSKTCICPSRPE